MRVVATALVTSQAVLVPSGAIPASFVIVQDVAFHTALVISSLYKCRFSTRLAHSNRASPLFTYRSTHSLSVTVAVVARVNDIGHIDRGAITLVVRGAKKLEPSGYASGIRPPSMSLVGAVSLVAIFDKVRN